MDEENEETEVIDLVGQTNADAVQGSLALQNPAAKPPEAVVCPKKCQSKLVAVPRPSKTEMDAIIEGWVDFFRNRHSICSC